MRKKNAAPRTNWLQDYSEITSEYLKQIFLNYFGITYKFFGFIEMISSHF